MIFLCATAVLAGCAAYRGGTGSDSTVTYGAGVSVTPTPSIVAETGSALNPSPPSRFPAADSEQTGPRPEIEGTRNWGKDVLPVSPGLNRENNNVHRL